MAVVQTCQSWGRLFSQNNNEQLEVEEISVSIAWFVFSQITYSDSGTSPIETLQLITNTLEKKASLNNTNVINY